jgi:hypothetical protein
MAITIPIFADFNDKGIKDAEGAFEKFGTKVAGIAKKAAAAFAVVGGAGLIVGKKAVDAASDLAESQAKIGEIFGDSASEIEDFAAIAAKKFGQSKQDVLNAAGVFGTFGKAAGLAGSDLAEFSNDFTGLASDLASFNNTTPQEAIDAIGAALRGENEPLRRYGVLLDDATLKAEAMALGIYKGKGALTSEQKILAAQAAIYKQTSDAQGDFARTSDGLANQQRILKAQLANATAELGEKLLPVVAKIAGFLNEKFIPIVEKVVSAFSEGGLAGLGKLIADAWPGIQSALGDIAKGIFNWIKETAPKVLEALGEMGQAFLEWIGPRIGPMLKQLAEFLGKAANWIIDEGIPLLTDKMIELGEKLVDWIKPRIVPMLQELGVWLGEILKWILTDAIPKLAAEALKIAGALLSWLAELAPKAIVGLVKFVGELVSKIPGIFASLVVKMGEMGLTVGQAIVDGIVTAVSALVDKGGEIAKKLINGVISFINTQFIQKINDLLEFTIPIPGLPDVNVNPPNIPRIPLLAEGGIVTRPTLAMVGEAGPEAVIPLNRTGMMGNITVNIMGSVQTENDLVESIRKGLVNAQRSGKGLVYSNT